MQAKQSIRVSPATAAGKISRNIQNEEGMPSKKPKLQR